MTIRAALVGYGKAGQGIHAPLLTSTDGIDLSWVVSRDAEKVHEDLWECSVGTFEQMLKSDVELVVLATPNDTHAELAIRALDAGKHVVVDKPFALDVEQAQAVADRSRASGRLVTVFHNRRWDGDFLSIRSCLSSGSLGTVTSFESRVDRFRPTVQKRWREGDGPGSGLFFDLGPHLVDQALVLFGRPQWVQGTIETQRPGAVTDDSFDVVLGYPGMSASLHASMLVAATPMKRFSINGTAGSVVCNGFDVQEEQLKAGLDPKHHRWGIDDEPCRRFAEDEHGRVVESTKPKQRGTWGTFYDNVRDAVLGHEPLLVTVGEAVQVVEIMDLIRHSATQGKRVDVAPSAVA